MPTCAPCLREQSATECVYPVQKSGAALKKGQSCVTCRWVFKLQNSCATHSIYVFDRTAKGRRSVPSFYGIYPMFTNKSRNVMRGAPRVVIAVIPESRTNVCTKTRGRNQRARATMSRVARSSQWILLLLWGPTRPPTLRVIYPMTSPVCFPPIYRSYTRWLRRSRNGVIYLPIPSSMQCQMYPLTTSA